MVKKAIMLGLAVLLLNACSKETNSIDQSTTNLVAKEDIKQQVEQALRQVGNPLGLRTAVVIGGVSQHKQVRALRNNPQNHLYFYHSLILV